MFIYYNTSDRTFEQPYSQFEGRGALYIAFYTDGKPIGILNYIVNGYRYGKNPSEYATSSSPIPPSDIGSVLSQWGGITVGDPNNTFQGQNTEGNLITGQGAQKRIEGWTKNRLNYGASLLCMQYRQNDLSFNLNSEGPACFSYNDGFSADSSGCLCDRSFNIGLIGYSTFNPWIYLEGTIQINSIYSTGSDPALGLYSCSSQQPFALIGVSSMTYTFGSDAPELTATGSTVKNCLLQVGDDGIKLGADCLSVDNVLLIQGNVGGNTINLGSYGDCNGQITTCNVRDVGFAYLNIANSTQAPFQPNYQAILASNNQSYGGLGNTCTSTCSDCDVNNFGCPYQSGCSSGQIIGKGGNYIVKDPGGAVCTSSKTCKRGMSGYDLKGYSIGSPELGQIQPVSNLTRAGGSIRGCFFGNPKAPSGSTISINNIIGTNSIINVIMLSTYLSPYNSTGSFTAYSGVYLDNVRLQGASISTDGQQTTSFGWTGGHERGSFSTVLPPQDYSSAASSPGLEFATPGGANITGVIWSQPINTAEETKLNRVVVGTTLQGGDPLNTNNIDAESKPIIGGTCPLPSQPPLGVGQIGYFYQPTYSFPSTVTGKKFEPISVNNIYAGDDAASNGDNIVPSIKKVLIAYDQSENLVGQASPAYILAIDEVGEGGALIFTSSKKSKNDTVFNPLPTPTDQPIEEGNDCNEQLNQQFVGDSIVGNQFSSSPTQSPLIGLNYYNTILRELFDSQPDIEIVN